MCLEGGFNLTKFCSNSKRILLSIPEEQELGVLWKMEEDLLWFKVSIKYKPTTRRGMLSILSSMYDLLGFGAPFLLRRKQILQRLKWKNMKWDTQLPEDLSTEWKKWKIKPPALQEVQIKRCFMQPDFGKVSKCSLHHFFDACKMIIVKLAIVAMVICSLVEGKWTVTPLKYISIPRLILVAATLSVKMSVMLRQELQFPDLKEMYWTHSNT